MSELISLKATARPRAGKGAARQARRDGLVPAVIYGNNKTPETINLDYHELWKQYLKGHFTSTAFEINVGDTKHLALARDVQLCPVRDTPLHVDFLRVGDDGVVRVSVPVHFKNEALSPGLKRGGVLNIVRHSIDVHAPYDKIPAEFVIDLTGLEIGKSIHISFVTLPDGVSPVISDRDFTIATIAGARTTTSDDEDKPTTEAGEGAAGADGKAAPAAAGAKPAAAAAKPGAKAAPAAAAAKPAAKK